MWVDNMVDNLTYSYLYTKRDVYYFSKPLQDYGKESLRFKKLDGNRLFMEF